MSNNKGKKTINSNNAISRAVGRNNSRISSKPPRNKPNKARMYELSIEIDSSNLKKMKMGLKFSKCWKLKGISDEKELKKQIKSVVDGSSQSQPTSPKPPNQTGGTKPTNVSLKTKDCYYLVIKLADHWNWQFDSNGPAFAIAAPTGSDELELAAEVFRQVGTYSSKIAYMVVDGKFAWNDDPKAPANKQYGCRYNIYVELNDPKTGAKLPIIIDPDVRWPDGLD